MKVFVQPRGKAATKSELVRLGHLARSLTHQVPAIRRLAEEVGKVGAHLPAARMFKLDIRIFLREFQSGILVVKGRGKDKLSTLLDHVLHRGGCACFVGDVLGFDDLDTFDILLDFHDGFVHGLVVTGICDGAAVQGANGQAGSGFRRERPWARERLRLAQGLPSGREAAPPVFQ